MREIDPLVSEYQHDKQRPREADALMTLRKVASLVKPIMRQRSWRVGTLCEFYPAERNLLGLNVNKGEKICLRLRYPSDERQFLPIDQVVDTMLHELCHNVHGPHDKHFHALWDQLRDEHEQLVRKGYTGEGFLSEGKRLGGQGVPIDEARRLARVAAEKRRTLNAGSGQRLGGTPIPRGTDMREVIADAVQRRIAVTKGCASGTNQGQKLAEEVSRNGFKTKAEEDDANEQAIIQAYVEMIQEEEREKYGSAYVPPSSANPAGPLSTLYPPTIPQSTKPGPALSAQKLGSDHVLIDLSDDDDSPSSTWSCQMCTLVNPASFLFCDACGSERPPHVQHTAAAKPSAKQPEDTSKRHSGTRNSFKPPSKALQSLIELEKKSTKQPLGWVCHLCGAFMETEWWACSACGTIKQAS